MQCLRASKQKCGSLEFLVCQACKEAVPLLYCSPFRCCSKRRYRRHICNEETASLIKDQLGSDYEFSSFRAMTYASYLPAVKSLPCRDVILDGMLSAVSACYSRFGAMRLPVAGNQKSQSDLNTYALDSTSNGISSQRPIVQVTEQSLARSMYLSNNAT